jgi:hypothetical protein
MFFEPFDLSELVTPKARVCDPGGNLTPLAKTYASEVEAYTNEVLNFDHFCVADERLKISIYNGGDTKSGTFTVWVG